MPSAKRSATQQQAVIGLDLGGTKLAAALFDTEGRPIVRRSLPLEKRQVHAVGELVASQVRRLLQTGEQRKLAIRAVGICVPGIVEPKTGRVWAPNIPGWDDYPLKAEIKAAVSDQAVKVAIDSDRSASILGEAWQGAARDCRNAILLAVGTGIGAGILVDGRVLHGAHGIAGAIGWFALDRPFRTDYTACGCFESHASGEGIAAVARDLVIKQHDYKGSLRMTQPVTAHDVFSAYEHGDVIAKKVLSDAIEFWGMASANLISLFNPEMIVFGGGVFGPATQFLEAIEMEACRWAQPVAMKQVKFCASQLEGDAALYGAAYGALRAARLVGPIGKQLTMYRKNHVFIAACLGMLLFGIVFLSLGSVNNMLAERFKLDDVAIGTLTALLPFGILVGSLIFGPVVDRFGYRWMLVGASLIVGLALEGMAFAGSKSLVQLFVFGIGFGGGILNGATNALAADVSEGERGAKLSLLGVFFGIGALAMPFTIATLSHRFAMSTIVAAIGALVLAPVAFCLAIQFPPPKLKSERLTIAGGLALLGDPFLLFACLALAIQSGLEGMSNDWMTRYFKNVSLAELENTEVRAQVALVVFTGTITVVRFALAWLLKRMSSRAVLLASLTTTTCGAMILMTTTNYNASLVGVILIGAGLAAVFPVVLGYVGDCYPQQSGTAFSTIFVLALVGNMMINKSFGYIAHEFGISQYPKMLIGLLAASAILLHVVCSLFAARTVR